MVTLGLSKTPPILGEVINQPGWPIRDELVLGTSAVDWIYGKWYWLTLTSALESIIDVSPMKSTNCLIIYQSTCDDSVVFCPVDQV